MTAYAAPVYFAGLAVAVLLETVDVEETTRELAAGVFTAEEEMLEEEAEVATTFGAAAVLVFHSLHVLVGTDEVEDTGFEEARVDEAVVVFDKAGDDVDTLEATRVLEELELPTGFVAGTDEVGIVETEVDDHSDQV